MKHRIRVAGLVRRGDQILLVEQQNPDNGHKRWTIPGGGLEHTDADIFAGVERELFEETGLSVRAGRVRYISEYISHERAVLMLSLWIDCHPLEGSDFGEPTLANTLVDDYITDIGWWTRDLLKDQKTSSALQKDDFWNHLQAPLESVVYLGRRSDQMDAIQGTPLLIYP